MKQTNDPDFDLLIQEHIAASPEDVFDAWTSARQMTMWWGLKEATCPSIEIDLKVGGAYRIENVFQDGRIVIITGVYQVIDRPKRLVYTWSVNDGTDELVNVAIAPDGAGSRVTVSHSMVPDKETRKGHLFGWRSSLAQLKANAESEA